jgi:hypothetical protein
MIPLYRFRTVAVAIRKRKQMRPWHRLLAEIAEYFWR